MRSKLRLPETEILDACERFFRGKTEQIILAIRHFKPDEALTLILPQNENVRDFAWGAGGAAVTEGARGM